MTATAISDGTLRTALQANTNTALTISEYQVTVSITPKQVGNFLSSPSAMQIFANQGADALKKAVADLYTTAFCAGTPTYTYALTAGKAHFAAATTTELAIWLKALLNVGATRGGDTSHWRCLMPPTEYSNFAGAIAALWPNFGFVDAGGMYVVHGCPTEAIPNASASFWGAVSNTAAAFVCPEAAPCKIGPVVSHIAVLPPWPDGEHPRRLLVRPRIKNRVNQSFWNSSSFGTKLALVLHALARIFHRAIEA